MKYQVFLKTGDLFRRRIYLLLNIDETRCLFPLGSGNTNKGADPGDEPQLHRVQVPTDQSTSLDEGRFTCQQVVWRKLPTSIR